MIIVNAIVKTRPVKIVILTMNMRTVNTQAVNTRKVST